MKAGDLIRVRYELDDEWYHGVIFETPELGEKCVWKMWCIERGKQHVLTPHKDEIEVISEG